MAGNGTSTCSSMHVVLPPVVDQWLYRSVATATATATATEEAAARVCLGGRWFSFDVFCVILFLSLGLPFLPFHVDWVEW